jgi:hypothetical protein
MEHPTVGDRMADGGGVRGGRTADASAAPDSLSGPGLTDSELTELALAADPDAAIGADAVPLAVYLRQAPGLLPEWYMPSPMSRHGGRWRLPVVLVIVAAFVIIEAFGLCSTFGQLVPA